MFSRRLRTLTMRQLEVFEAVARSGSVTRAAEALHLTQPAVSQQLRSLAEAVGHALTAPAGRGLRLTAAGRELHEACRELAAGWSRFEARLGEVAALRRGSLSVSVVTTAKYFLPRALGRFVQAHPGIEVELDIQNREGVLARLRDRRDDLHVMSAPPEGWAIEAERFLDNPLVVIAPRSFAAPAREPSLAQLGSERFLLREPGSGTRLAVDEHLARTRTRLSHRMTVGSNEAIKQAVAGGLGLAILSRHTLAESDFADLRILPVKGFPIARSWYIVHWRDSPLSAAAEAFRRFLRESLNAGHPGARLRAKPSPAGIPSPRRARNP